MVFDIDARDAIAGGGNQVAVVEADFERAGFDIGVPIEIARAETEVPFADDAAGVAGRFQSAGKRLCARRNDQLRIAGQNRRAGLAPGAAATRPRSRR